MEASTELMFALISAVVGIVVGALGYRLTSKSQHNVTAMQQKLLESERQVAELKKRMGSHLLETQQRLDTIRDQASVLEQQLSQEAQHWHLSDDAFRHLDLSGLRTTEANEAEGSAKPAAPGVPRDYADGQGGTLSEDFGLKEADKTPQPPRY
ncbi:YhcB family protein [Vreelandella massiliensis]|uniref:YhcB family protein n=1 Tax=Vreelandella massiliensis TaxID=1816686 RepID=UPI00096A6BB8|nr:DUF1043 family protein [Halomonas massiliensis]